MVYGVYTFQTGSVPRGSRETVSEKLDVLRLYRLGIRFLISPKRVSPKKNTTKEESVEVTSMATAEEFKTHAKRKAKELNLPDDVVLSAESFYKRYNELADEIQGKEMNDILNVIIRELARTARIDALDKDSRTLLRHLLSNPSLWKRKLL